MRSQRIRPQRIRRLLTGGAVFALVVATATTTAAAATSTTAENGDAKTAAAATSAAATTTAATNAAGSTNAGSSAAAQAAAQGKSFDPAHAFVPGSSGTSGDAKTTQDGDQPPGAGGAGSAPVHAANANGGSLGLNLNGSVETDQGTAMSGALPGGGSLEVYSLGVISRVGSDGSTVWQRSTGSLYRDWHVSLSDGAYTSTPQLAIGTDPVDPFDVTTAESYAETDSHPYAIGSLAGPGSTDIAVAETVGVNLGASICSCGGYFTVPGSDLHVGTFVTVLNAQTGATLYSELDPGFVTQLAIVGGNLVVGDETGSPSTPNGPGAWNSVSTVRALTLHSGRGGQGAQAGLTATQAWQYSTKAQWGMLLGMQAIGDNVAIAWTDTPLGLGQPGPPDGHVVLLGSRGQVNWDQRTAGYPVLSQYDPSRGELAVVEETDATQALSYTVAGLSVSNGRAVSSVTTTGVVPTVLSVSSLTPFGKPSWIVGGIATQPAYVSPPYYAFTSGTVSAFDPDNGATQWTHTLVSGENPPQPGAIEVVPGARGQNAVVVSSWEGTMAPDPTTHLLEYNDLEALSGTTGAQVWDRQGDVPDPLTLSASASASPSGSTVRGITAEQDALSYDVAKGQQVGDAPMMAMFNTVVADDVTGSGRLDYIAGDESGAVYAIDSATLTTGDDSPRVLWRADLGGPVTEIVPSTMNGRRVLAVAATNGIGLIDERTGHVLQWVALRDQYVWNVAIGSVGGRTVLATATDRLSAFDAQTGKALWTYQRSGASYFSDAAVSHGVVVSEYQQQPGQSPSSTSMAAIGIDAVSGKTAWTVAADPTTIAAAQLSDGVVAGQDIPGAGSDGAAFTWVDSSGDGQVDVRDAATGALIYSDTSPDLNSHESYTLDPGVGLISIGEGGTVSISPSGATGVDWLTGDSVAIAHAGGTPVLLNASAGMSAYPMSALSDSANAVDPLASSVTLLPGSVYVAPNNAVLTTPIYWFKHEIMSAEAGQFAFPYNLGAQQGLSVLSLSGTPAANAARSTPQRTQAPETKPGSVPLAGADADNGRIAVVQPTAQVEVHGYSSAGVPQVTSSTPTGYDPATIKAYLGLHGTGAGQTVAVVDAFGDPNIVSDVNQFSTQFGLPQTCSGGATSGCFDLTVDPIDGATSGTADPDWGLEMAMDVEWIHAVAPQASIDLVEAAVGSFSSLFNAVDAAAQLKPDAISMSWGLPEEFTDETYYDHFCQLADSLCVVSSGDYGHPGSYPAYNPATLAIGGTTLNLAADGTVTGETAWSSSGGGQSYVEPTPSYQASVAPGGRGIPDVSYDANPSTGVAVYDSYAYLGQSGWFQVGGTSLGAPSWAAILTATDQVRADAGRPRLTSAGYAAQQAIYSSAGSLGQITSGSNGSCPTICSAGPGYDFVTGLGSPRSGLDATLAAAG